MTPQTDALHIASSRLSADIATTGAEFRNLSDADGNRIQWDGDPAVWNGRAPILFPVIGVLADGGYRLGDRRYAMPKHGFARHATFEVVDHWPDRVALRLSPSDDTRAIYPFEFRLDVVHAIVGATLQVEATVSNDGNETMPASLGFHPAFRWPLPYGRPRAEHAIVFEQAEADPIRRLDAAGFLRAASQPTPIVDDTFVLRDALFDDDAVIFDRLRSRAVRYGARSGPQVVVRFDNFPTLGVWTKPGGAQFVCIEPWQGFADPVGFDGTIEDKPGIVAIAAGASRRFAMTITLEDQPG